MNNWFDVSKDGLAQLQKGKSKTFIINELIQNAFDEDITVCQVYISFLNNHLHLSVYDDSPRGFRELSHSYTLYADTYKRGDPKKRGRFNLGEKQVLSICKKATVETTTGTVIFDETGRHEKPEKTKKGSIVTIDLDATENEYKELLKHTQLLLVPEHIKFIVNDKVIKSKPVFKSFDCSLLTEILENDVMRHRWRKTQVNLIEHDNDKSYIYEMGIPIVETDCPWHIDIQQKIQLNIDRDNILQSYLQDLYAEVLNNTYDDVEEPSALWVRTGMKDDRIKKETVEEIVTKRFGEKVASVNPFDPNANDEATSHGFNVIKGSQMSKEEWNQIKRYDIIKSTSTMFGGTGLAEEKTVTPKDVQYVFAEFAQKVAREALKVNISVHFVRSGISASAYYNPGAHSLTFNLSKLPGNFFDDITQQNIDLLVHELGHEKGNHTEHNYHKCITKLAGWMVMKALQDPSFFEVN